MLLDVKAAEWFKPEDTEVKEENLSLARSQAFTNTGELLDSVELSPNWPVAFNPNPNNWSPNPVWLFTESLNKTYVESCPTYTLDQFFWFTQRTGSTPSIICKVFGNAISGVVLLTVVPVPNWPAAFLPQVKSTPSFVNAAVCVAPNLTSFHNNVEFVNTGDDLLVVVASPIWPVALFPQIYKLLVSIVKPPELNPPASGDVQV